MERADRERATDPGFINYERNELITFLIASLALVFPTFSSSVPVLVHHHHHKPKVVDKRIGIVRPWDSKLNRMAWCESTGRWYIATGNGFYGGLQFTLQTWRSVGGSGYPNQNSVLEQKYRAVLVHNRAGTWTRDWPVCGYR